MAISWQVTITVLSIERKEISVIATREDDEDPDNPRTYRIPWTEIATPAQKTAAIDKIWSLHQAAIAREGQVSTVVGTLETQAKALLEAKEE